MAQKSNVQARAAQTEPKTADQSMAAAMPRVSLANEAQIDTRPAASASVLALLDRPPGPVPTASGKPLAMTSPQRRAPSANAALEPLSDKAAPARPKRKPARLAADGVHLQAAADLVGVSSRNQPALAGALSGTPSTAGSAALADASPGESSVISLRDLIPRPAF
jgi:hypothetical protein